jgi:hypothetical protein
VDVGCGWLVIAGVVVGIGSMTRRRREVLPWILLCGVVAAWGWSRVGAHRDEPPVVVAPVVVPPVIVAPVVVSPVVVPPVVVAPVMAAPVVPAGSGPIPTEAFTDLVLDLRARLFGSERLDHLRGEAGRWMFTPSQAARIVICFEFDDEKLGALEILAPRLLPGDRGPLLDAFSGPFGEARQARLILGR